jgi:hypothetical protein
MRYNPRSAEMIEGETNKAIFNLAPALGPNTIQGTPTLTACPGDLIFTDTSVDGALVTTFISGGIANRDYDVVLTANVSSGETKVGAIRLEWKKPGFDDRTGVR